MTVTSFGAPAVLLGAMTLFCIAARAADPPAGELDLGTAVALALERNPDLKSTTLALKVADAGIEQAGLRPAPEARLELEDFAGSGATAGVDALQTTLTLSRVIELGDKRALRIGVAEAGRALADRDREIAELDLVAEVARRFLHVVSDQVQLELTREATRLAENTVEAVGDRVAAAKAPEVELHRARIALSRTRIEREHAEHELAVTRRKLAAMWGDTETQFARARAELFELPALAEFQSLAEKLERDPGIMRLLSEARLHEAERHLAEAKRRSDIQIGGGIRRLEAIDDFALVAQVSVPLFPAHRASPAIAEATARQAQAETRHEAALVRANTRLFELYQELRHARTETGVLREEVLPEMEEALRQTEQAYRHGRYSYLEWVDAQGELLDIRRRLIETATTAHLLLIEIERLTGEAAVMAAQ
jgi:cobalt-zinc-cadmium efflux system outer membrane protein